MKINNRRSVEFSDIFYENIILKDKSAVLQAVIDDAYYLDFVEGSETLVIVFPPFGQSVGENIRKIPCWANGFLRKRGYSILGFKLKNPDWFRNAQLHQYLRSPRFRKFLESFERVVFYGGSMGGYAALAFSELIAKAEVLALSPQFTLNPVTVPWEPRWVEAGQKQDWDGDFANAADNCKSAARVVVTYDPHFKLDAKHIEQLYSSNVLKLPVPNVGHSTVMWLNRMGILSNLFDSFMDGTLEKRAFTSLVRQRSRMLPHYYLTLSQRLSKNKKKSLIDRAEKLLYENIHDFREVAKCYINIGDFPAAKLVFTSRYARFLHSADFHFQASKIFDLCGDFKVAHEFAARASAIHPTAVIYKKWVSTMAIRL